MVAPKFEPLVAANVADELENDADRDPERLTRIEIPFQKKDKTEYEGEMIVKFLRDAEGKPNGVLGVSRDISDRKRLENAMRSVLKGTELAQGGEYFNSLVKNIALETKIKCIVLGRIDNQEKVVTLSVWLEGSLQTTLNIFLKAHLVRQLKT